MKRSFKFLAAVALLALAFAPSSALAFNSLSTTIPVSATVTQGCFVQGSPLTFGSVSPLLIEQDLATPPYSATTTLLLVCGTNGPSVPVVISLDNGANPGIAGFIDIGESNPSGGKAQPVRVMTNSTDFLGYDLFVPNGLDPSTGIVSATPLSCPTDGSSAVEFTTSDLQPGTLGYNALRFGANPFAAVTICGSIPTDQVQPLGPGLYTDTVTATVTF